MGRRSTLPVELHPILVGGLDAVEHDECRLATTHFIRPERRAELYVQFFGRTVRLIRSQYFVRSKYLGLPPRTFQFLNGISSTRELNRCMIFVWYD